MAGTLDYSACDKIRAILLVPGRVLGRCTKTAIRPAQYDGRHRYRRGFCKLPLDFDESFFTRRIHMAVPVRMQGNLNEVGIIERRGRAIENFVRVFPPGRPCIPKVADDVSSVLFKTYSPLVSIEIPLIPALRFIAG